MPADEVDSFIFVLGDEADSLSEALDDIDITSTLYQRQRTSL